MFGSEFRALKGLLSRFPVPIPVGKSFRKLIRGPFSDSARDFTNPAFLLGDAGFLAGNKPLPESDPVCSLLMVAGMVTPDHPQSPVIGLPRTGEPLFEDFPLFAGGECPEFSGYEVIFRGDPLARE